MPLEIGTQLGPYKIIGVLGKGGMGEVYRAHDPRLQRDVAIKVSAQRFSERFEREARAVAALNHPNICQIYDVGPNYLVMELIEGPTLSERIKEGAIPVDESLTYARQIAAALQDAHDKHITHRDLKPGNIKIKPDGGVKVLDFGLAKFGNTPTAISEDSPTLSMAATQAGVILGTAAYMAPEQARGRPVDPRADIWAFGVVLYEMVMGKRPFKGEDLTETLASVVKEHPNLSAVPARVRPLVESCLQKDPKKRLQAIGDMELLLAPAAKAPPAMRWLWPAVAEIALLAAAALAAIHFREAPREDAALRLSVPVPQGDIGLGFMVPSPDGKRVAAAFTLDKVYRLRVRPLDGTDWILLDSTGGVRAPFWSPDSRFIGFFAQGELKIVPAAGGPAKNLCSDTGLGQGGTWDRDGVILFASDTGPLRKVNSSGGDCSNVTKAHVVLPEWLPDGKHFLYTGQVPGDAATHGVYAASVDDALGENLPGRKILDDYSSAIFAPLEGDVGHILFLRGTTVMAQSFDAAKLQTMGDPVKLAEDGSTSFTNPQMAAGISSNGTLMYLANRSLNYQLTWIDRSGRQRVKVGSPADFRGNALSPDGSRAALYGRNEGAHLYDFARNTEARFSTDASPSPGVWSPDGSELVFDSTIGGVYGIYRKASNGSGKESLVLAGSGNVRKPSDWSRDGRYLFFTEIDPKTRGDIWYLPNPANPQSKPVKFLGTDAVESQAQLSPDGKWLAYSSIETGEEVYIRQFPSGPGFAKVSVNGGSEPRWSKSGAELFYRHSGENLNELMAVPMPPDGHGGIAVGTPTSLFSFRSLTTTQEQNAWLYSPHPDGQRFLVSTQEDAMMPSIQIITNWRNAMSER